MERFGVMGISHRHATAEELGAFSRKLTHQRALLDHLGVDELLHLSTCNRVEVYWVSHDKLPAEKLLRELAEWDQENSPDMTPLASRIGYALNGEAVQRHMNEVLCGMKSLVLGDEQIISQFRQALSEARDRGTCGQWLGILSDEALKVSRRIRSVVDYSRIPTSVPEVAAEVLKKELKGKGGRITLLGSGEMTRIMAARIEGWKNLSLCFVNRTEEKARALADEFGGVSQSLEDFQSAPHDFDHLVSATSSTSPLVTPGMLETLPRTNKIRLLLDLGVPADTHLSICELPGFHRMDVLEVSRRMEVNRQEAQQLRDSVAHHLEDAVVRFKERVFQRNLGPIANRLRQAVEERAQIETNRWLSSTLAHLSDGDKELFRQFAMRLASQTVQVPLIALKKTLRDIPMGESVLSQLRQEGRRAQHRMEEDDSQ